jgi:hypothetical protein
MILLAKSKRLYWRVKWIGEAAMLKPESILEIPAETKTIAGKAFPKGNTYLKLRDELGPLFDDELFAELYPA